MKNNREIQFMWNITRLINREHCNGKLKIHKIYFYNKGGPKLLGYYRTLANGKKVIAIYSKSDKFSKVKTLIHELSHAYVDQIINFQYHQDLSKFIRKQPICSYDKENITEIISHNKKFTNIRTLFIKTLDKYLKMSLK